MEFTDPLGLREDDPLQTDRYRDVYPNFHLPSDGHPRISEVFYANTQLISNDNFPMTLIHMPEWEKDYHTTMFGVDCGNGIVYAIYQEGAKITNKRGWIGEEESTSGPESDIMPPMTSNVTNCINSTHCFPLLQAASTPAVNPSKRPTPVASSATQASVITPIQTTTQKEIRQEVIELSSVSSMGEEEIIVMTPEIRDKIMKKSGW